MTRIGSFVIASETAGTEQEKLRAYLNDPLRRASQHIGSQLAAAMGEARYLKEIMRNVL